MFSLIHRTKRTLTSKPTNKPINPVPKSITVAFHLPKDSSKFLAAKAQLKAEQVRRICDRKSGIGADGFIRITKQNNQWFMDYRNADGSIAEMCGNGIRVMARYLQERGHQPSGIFSIDTRAGRKFLAVPDTGDISVNMGQVSKIPGGITVVENNNTYRGLNIDMGSPHAVAFVGTLS